LEKLDDADDIKPLKALSLGGATASGLGSAGAESGDGACVFVPGAFDFTKSGVELGFFASSPESSAIRVSGRVAAPDDGMSGDVTVAVLPDAVWVAELARLGVLGEGATFAEDMGAGAGCAESCFPESEGVFTCGAGVAVVDLPSFAYPM